jgi:diketogulonate reductase-like aldo/keto reductase
MIDRRTLALTGAAALAAAALPASARAAASSAVSSVLTRPIPSTGARIPAVGMGTWITFNVGGSEALRADRLQVLKTFFALGGGMVDSSPMYGTAQDVLGWCLARMEPGEASGLFSATKVWTPAGGSGADQVAEAERLWGLESFDLMQVHNLVDADAHLAMLFEMKAAGRIRHVGVTTSHGSRHAAVAAVMRAHPLDFVQFTYNVLDRQAERELLPLAAERGVAVIVNRPFRRGALFDRFQREPLPGWAAEIGAANWAQVFLKFIVSHPAVTCAIPATSQVVHMRENMGALHGPLPDAALRARMARDLDALA